MRVSDPHSGMPLPSRKCDASLVYVLQLCFMRSYVCAVKRGCTSRLKSSKSSCQQQPPQGRGRERSVRGREGAGVRWVLGKGNQPMRLNR